MLLFIDTDELTALSYTILLLTGLIYYTFDSVLQDIRTLFLVIALFHYYEVKNVLIIFSGRLEINKIDKKYNFDNFILTCLTLFLILDKNYKSYEFTYNVHL